MNRKGAFVLGLLLSVTAATIAATSGGLPSRPRFAAIGLNTTAPAAAGTLQATTAANGQVTLNSTAAAGSFQGFQRSSTEYGRVGSGSLVAATGGATDAMAIGSIGAQPLQFGTNGTVRMAVSSGGNVTVNAPTSGAPLSLTAPALGSALLTTDGTRSFRQQFASGAIEVGAFSAHGLNLVANGATALTISSAGVVDIVTAGNLTAGGKPVARHAQVRTNTAGTILGDTNVASITDVAGTGVWDINFDSGTFSTTPACVCVIQGSAGFCNQIGTASNTTVRIETRNSAAAVTDLGFNAICAE